MSDSKINKIIDEIKKLNTVELNDLVKSIEKEFDVSATMQVASAGPAADAGDSSEPSTVSVTLKSFGGNKVSVIKVVKEITGLGLMDAKKLVEGVPAKIKENISTDEAKELSEKLVAAGAEVEVK